MEKKKEEEEEDPKNEVKARGGGETCPSSFDGMEKKMERPGLGRRGVLQHAEKKKARGGDPSS